MARISTRTLLVVAAAALLCLAALGGTALAAPGDSGANATLLNDYFGSSLTTSLVGTPTGYYYFKAELSGGDILRTDFRSSPSVVNLKALLWPPYKAGYPILESTTLSPSLARFTFTAPEYAMYSIYVGTSSLGTFTAEPAKFNWDRLAGADRVGTSVKISQSAFAKYSHRAVVIAPGGRWQEPLIGSSLAGQVSGPILLVYGRTWSTQVVAEIKRIGAPKVYIVGSTAVLGTAVETILKSAGYTGTMVERLGGTAADPMGYNASLAVAQKVRALRGTPGGTMFIATDGKPWDAMSASSLAVKLKAPIVLTPLTGLPTATHDALASVQPTMVIAAGGTGAVPAARLADAATAAGSADTTQLAGIDRFETSAKIAGYGVGLYGAPTNVYFAWGRNYPDALAGGVVAGNGPSGRWQPLLLTEYSTLGSPTGLYDNAATFVATYPLRLGHLLGGTGVLSNSIGTAFVNTAK
jgi:hypothetical protein